MTMCSPSSDDAYDDKEKLNRPISGNPPASHQIHALKRIVAHYGPLTVDHPAFIGSKFNVLVEWDDCRYSTETLENIINTELLKVLQYSTDCGLFNDSKWRNNFPAHISSQIPCVLPPIQSDALRHDLDHCRAVATAVRKSFDECLLYSADDSCRTLREGVCEIFVGT